MNNSNIHSYIVLLLITCATCYAGKGFDKISEYLFMEETFGTQVWSKEAVSLGTNIIDRCKTDSAFLDKLCEEFKRQALSDDNVPALMLAKCMHNFAPKKGEAFLLELAEDSDTDAMILLAVLYYDDNINDALKWLRNAAEKEDQDAIQFLVSDYSEMIPKQEYIKYLKWQADKKQPGGLIGLSVAYMNGEGVETDEQKACELLEQAWDVGVPEVALMLALLYKNSDRELSLKWMERGAKAGDRTAQYEWAEVLLGGKYTEKRVDEGLIWLNKSAVAGYSPAQYAAGILYLNGDLVEQNDELALSYFLKSADQNDSDSQYEAGLLYKKQNDQINAYKWIWRSAQQGHSDALYALHEMENNMSASEIETAKKILKQ